MPNPSTLLAIPSKFRQTALAFPDKVRQAVALLDDPNELSEMLAKADAMAAYTKHIKESTDINNAIQFGRLHIESALGRVMAAQQGKGGGRGKKKTDKTSSSGQRKFSDQTLANYRKVSRNADKLDEYKAKIDEHNAALPDDSPDAIEASTAAFLRFVGSDGNIKSNQNNGVVEWYTPSEYVEASRKVMGGIGLDPASCEFSQRIIQASAFYTKDDNGLEQKWSGTVFLNPPFKMPEVEQFVLKLCSHVEACDVSQAILVTNNNTDAKWWHSAAEASVAICFTRGRIKWYNAAQPDCSPTNGQTFFYFGGKAKTFCKVFSQFGFCVETVV